MCPSAKGRRLHGRRPSSSRSTVWQPNELAITILRAAIWANEIDLIDILTRSLPTCDKWIRYCCYLYHIEKSWSQSDIPVDAAQVIRWIIRDQWATGIVGHSRPNRRSTMGRVLDEARQRLLIWTAKKPRSESFEAGTVSDGGCGSDAQ